MPLQVVHLNSSALSETPMMLEMIEAARAAGHDVSAEAYPYTAGMTEIQSATIQDIYKSAPDDRLAAIEWPRTGERLNRDSFDQYTRTGGPIVVHSNTEEMVAIAIASPLTMIASDAYWQNGTGHPRTAGTFSRVLGRYVRETQVLTLMAQGMSVPAIAQELVLGATTVKTHVGHLYEKLGVSDRAAAVAEAMRRGLIE